LAHRRIVAKVGSNLLSGKSGLDLEVMAGLVAQMAELKEAGAELILVTSGAVLAGRRILGDPKERRDVPFRQMMAAVGQSRLMYVYDLLFSWHGITIAQALLAKRDLSDRLGYLNTRNTLLGLLDLGVVTIVNENDVVATEELEGGTFGDNDTLSALVANLVDADLLVLLSDIDGLYTADPHRDRDAKLIPIVERIDTNIEAFAGDAAQRNGTGGMATKVQAARLATSAGTTVAIASGREPLVLSRLTQGESVGTLFQPTGSRLESRKRWMLAGLSARGHLILDEGAAAALRRQNRSLLPAGVQTIEGEFQRGDTVTLMGPDRVALGYGIANYGAAELSVIRGQRSDRIGALLGYDHGSEVVHRNNFVGV
jgi:glutamate 5-kinase